MPQLDLLRVMHTHVHVLAWRKANFQLLNKSLGNWICQSTYRVKTVWSNASSTCSLACQDLVKKSSLILFPCLWSLELGLLYFKQSRQLQVSVTNKTLFISTGVFEKNAHPLTQTSLETPVPPFSMLTG